MTRRVSQIERVTQETNIRLRLGLEGEGRISIASGIGFLDHLLTALAFHARFDLDLACQGDLQIDDHHTVEDCALALGTAIDRALGTRSGITRFGWAYAPLDEALARCVIDLSGRPCAVVRVDLRRERLGDLACENISHFIVSLATTARASVHVDVLRGENDHHRAEASFKALALALRQAVTLTASADVPSTKGCLS
ncbi:MAG: imidazoleglycerol-phosphate dehydratase HisB [Phycisphaerales bacterium]|nr:imidazoleglycerol-phosphate dehydratase HisB [Phycisphaerales bacterium]